MDDLRALGARSVPVVSRNGEFVFAQVISDVVQFLDLEEDTAPALSPSDLAEKYRRVLDAAVAYMHQMPADALERELPNRPRSWRVLMHHVFQIPNAFLDAQAENRSLTYEDLLAGPPETMQDGPTIAAFGESVREKFSAWWESARESDFGATVPAYFGDTTLHELFERTVWHSTQHARQIASLLEQVNISPKPEMNQELLDGLPLTEKVWDE
ncbi:MAG: DinB family protein [Gammaproteobacteria bacterium]|nr:DinB family protein [Gammaproteobacteria bacterium]